MNIETIQEYAKENIPFFSSARKNTMFGSNGVEITIRGKCDRKKVNELLKEEFPRIKFNIVVWPE